MIALPVLFALGFAAYRGTRLFVFDTITEPLRDKIAERYAYSTGLRERVWDFVHSLIQCTYCTGFWVSVVTVLVYRLAVTGEWGNGDTSVDELATFGVEVFAVAGVQALLNRWDSRAD